MWSVTCKSTTLLRTLGAQRSLPVEAESGLPTNISSHTVNAWIVFDDGVPVTMRSPYMAGFKLQAHMRTSKAWFNALQRRTRYLRQLQPIFC